MKLTHREPVRSFLTGALAGGAVAFLLAPAPGRDTRARIVTEVAHATTATQRLGEKVARKGREALAGVAATLDRIARR
jgi:gas vesicle protein